MYKFIYREIARAWVMADNLMQRKTQQELENGRHPMNGEHDYECQVPGVINSSIYLT